MPMPRDLCAELTGPVRAAVQRLIAGRPRLSAEGGDDVLVLDALRHAAQRIDELERALAVQRRRPPP